MSNTASLKVSENVGFYEGTLTISGLRPTKLVKSDGKTTYATRSAVTQAAQAVARRLNLTVVTATQTTSKVAAKKSNSGTCCQS